MARNKNSIKKAKLFITIVDRNKVEFYTDVLSQFESNLQLVMYGNGTANNSTLELLGLNNEKGIILLLSDSTNAGVSNFAPSERKISQNINTIFSKIKGRVIKGDRDKYVCSSWN